jgi:hypothetical protein
MPNLRLVMFASPKIWLPPRNGIRHTAAPDFRLPQGFDWGRMLVTQTGFIFLSVFSGVGNEWITE